MAFNFTYSTPVSGEVTITGSSGTPTPGSTITIPKEDGSGHKVVGIADNSFLTFNNQVFESGTFVLTFEHPSNIRTIGRFAFGGCIGFTGSLTIPDSVTSIGVSAFNTCSGFTGSLTIPDSVTSIGQYAFYNCSKFTGSLTIPNSLTTISTSAFQGCSGFTGSLTIPNSVTSIGLNAFYNCGFTGPLTIPNSVTSIGLNVFQSCGFTGSLTISKSLTTISDSAFQSCVFTGSLKIPDSVTSIGAYAFYNCGFTMGPLTIPNSVTSIGQYAFSNYFDSYFIGTTNSNLRNLVINSFPPNITANFYTSTSDSLNLTISNPSGQVSTTSSIPSGLSFDNGILYGKFQESDTYRITFNNTLSIDFVVSDPPHCLLSNSPVLMEDKTEKLIKDLKKGDIIFPSQKIVNVGYKQVDLSTIPRENLPYRVPKDFFSLGVPSADTYISGYHRIVRELTPNSLLGVQTFKLIPAEYRIDDENVIRKLTGEDEVRYYHIDAEFPYFFVNNLPVETIEKGAFEKDGMTTASY
jgi:hypothetical protein